MVPGLGLHRSRHAHLRSDAGMIHVVGLAHSLLSETVRAVKEVPPASQPAIEDFRADLVRIDVPTLAWLNQAGMCKWHDYMHSSRPDSGSGVLALMKERALCHGILQPPVKQSNL